MEFPGIYRTFAVGKTLIGKKVNFPISKADGLTLGLVICYTIKGPGCFAWGYEKVKI